mmetsp:Transcript_29289/g.51413  ORF Transcript_29289/g.51413 Transcript_29289/m.51413 type:complete len:238 (+) Transcript_29289:316-1029(+)
MQRRNLAKVLRTEHAWPHERHVWALSCFLPWECRVWHIHCIFEIARGAVESTALEDQKPVGERRGLLRAHEPQSRFPSERYCGDGVQCRVLQWRARDYRNSFRTSLVRPVHPPRQECGSEKPGRLATPLRRPDPLEVGERLASADTQPARATGRFELRLFKRRGELDACTEHAVQLHHQIHGRDAGGGEWLWKPSTAGILRLCCSRWSSVMVDQWGEHGETPQRHKHVDFVPKIEGK